MSAREPVRHPSELIARLMGDSGKYSSALAPILAKLTPEEDTVVRWAFSGLLPTRGPEPRRGSEGDTRAAGGCTTVAARSNVNGAAPL